MRNGYVVNVNSIDINIVCATGYYIVDVTLSVDELTDGQSDFQSTTQAKISYCLRGVVAALRRLVAEAFLLRYSS